MIWTSNAFNAPLENPDSWSTLITDVARYVAEHSRCNIMVVEDEEQLTKVQQIEDQLPELQTIIQYSGFPRWENISV